MWKDWKNEKPKWTDLEEVGVKEWGNGDSKVVCLF